VSKAGFEDDVDKTIAAAVIMKRLQSDLSAFSDPATAGELAIPFDDPPPKTKRKGDRVKSGTGMNGTIPTVARRTPPNRLESMETSGAEASIVGEVDERAIESRQDPAPELNFASGERHGSQSGSKPSSAMLTSCLACLGTVIHPLEVCPVVQGGPDSVEERIAQMEKNPGLAPSSEIIAALRKFTEKARPISSGSRNDSLDMEPSRVFIPSVTLYNGGSSTGAIPTIPKGHEISEVSVEAHGEGSSSESSTEDENEEDNVTQKRTPVNASFMNLHLEDQLVPLLHNSAKRGPRRSVLDEIPSSSETESKSTSEDLMLDEEEDLSIQPSHKQTRKLSMTRQSLIEPDLTSEDEEDPSVPIYMDISHKAVNHSQVCIVHFVDQLTRRLTNACIRFLLSVGLGIVNP